MACAGNTAETTSAAAKTQETAADTASKAEETTGAEASESETAAKAEGTTYKIGVLQLVQHTALDAANDGFIAALDDAGIAYEVDQQNASGDQSACQTVASKFANEKKDLILAIATPAAQAMVGAVEDTPVLITAVTDPAESGLVDTNEKPGANVTGTSDLTPVKEQIDLLKQLVPEAKTVGVLYCSAESNSKIQADMAKEAIAAAGMESKEYTVSSSNEIQTVVQSMVGAVDAVYAPTDNVIAAGMATVGMVAGDNNLPVICGEAGMVQNGGLATYGIDYYQLGYMTGQQAVKILTEGASPADMPIEYLPAEKCELTVNEETAQTLGIDVSGLK
ncbi:ABC transporter substrate-binding protein [Enterocloster bolteae]|uniref:ABC transporter substrate-binding protein n=1 Tax=Enterocloster bolteae TaxID=208479 RepID=UPI002A804574|nr:ABC transporter substrate-binding protein [Enterocloster bolteae]